MGPLPHPISFGWDHASTKASTVADPDNVHVASDQSDVEPESDAQAGPARIPGKMAAGKETSVKPYMRKVIAKKVRTKKIPLRKPAATKVREENTPKISELEGPVVVDFTDPAALNRGRSDMNPGTVYRYHYENSATLSRYVMPIQHTNHVEVPALKLKDGNAFQAIGTLRYNLDFTKERTMRHFVAHKKRDPSPFISTMASLKDAEKRVKRMHKTSRKAPRRMLIAKIDISRLVPATIKVKMSTILDTHDFEKEPDSIPIVNMSTTETRTVNIPVWVLDKKSYRGGPGTRPSCEVDDILKARGIFWFCVNELKKSDLRVWASATHMNEWLAVGNIPESIVIHVMPFDGAVLHTAKRPEPVRARTTEEPHYWNFDEKYWVHDPDLNKNWRPYREAKLGDKRTNDGTDRYCKIGALVAKILRQAETRDQVEGDASDEDVEDEEYASDEDVEDEENASDEDI